VWRCLRSVTVWPLCRVLTIPPVAAETSPFCRWAVSVRLGALWQPSGWSFASWVIPIFRHLDHAETRLCEAKSRRCAVAAAALVPSQKCAVTIVVSPDRKAARKPTAAPSAATMMRRGALGSRDEHGICAEGR
jgi:hypothetical protein